VAPLSLASGRDLFHFDLIQEQFFYRLRLFINRDRELEALPAPGSENVVDKTCFVEILELTVNILAMLISI
jgi:hypothetical protein